MGYFVFITEILRLVSYRVNRLDISCYSDVVTWRILYMFSNTMPHFLHFSLFEILVIDELVDKFD